MCSERAGFSQRHAGLKRQEGLWDDRQRWLPRQQGWTHIPKGCNDRSEVHPCTWRDIRSLCLWCNCSDLDEKFPKLLVATCLLNDQNEKKIKFPNLTFLGIKSPQHHVVYAFFMYIALWYGYRGKKIYCTLIQTCYVHLLSTSVWNECLDRPHVVTLCVSAGQISGGSSTLLRGAYVSPTDDLKYNQVRPKPAQASTTALTSRVFTSFVWLQLLTAPRSLMFME